MSIKPLHLTPWLIFENLSFICDKTNVQSQNGGAGELYVRRAEVNENRGIIHLRPEPRQPDIRRTKHPSHSTLSKRPGMALPTDGWKGYEV